jgi:hypothetical protein
MAADLKGLSLRLATQVVANQSQVIILVKVYSLAQAVLVLGKSLALLSLLCLLSLVVPAVKVTQSATWPVQVMHVKQAMYVLIKMLITVRLWVFSYRQSSLCWKPGSRMSRRKCFRSRT